MCPLQCVQSFAYEHICDKCMILFMNGLHNMGQSRLRGITVGGGLGRFEHPFVHQPWYLFPGLNIFFHSL